MRKILYSLIIFSLFSCGSKNELTIEVINPSLFDRSEDIVEIDLSSLSDLKLDSLETYLVYDENNLEQVSQVTYDNKLIFQANMKANAGQKFSIRKGAKKTNQAQVFGRQYPERFGDFAWENDKVGFRFYGKELKAVQAPTNGLDLWYKRTPKMILDEWYRKDISKEASYHEDHGEGCDPYAVGTTLGAGAIAPYINGVLLRNENYESSEMLDNGPLRITFKLTYPTLSLNDSIVIKDEKVISLDAGSQLTKIVQDYGDVSLTVASGIVKREAGQDNLLVSADNKYLIYSEPIDPNNGQIFLSLFFPDSFQECTVDQYNLNGTDCYHSLAIQEYQSKPITYYTGFGWNKFGFETVSDFENYIQEFDQKIQNPLTVKINKP